MGFQKPQTGYCKQKQTKWAMPLSQQTNTNQLFTLLATVTIQKYYETVSVRKATAMKDTRKDKQTSHNRKRSTKGDLSVVTIVTLCVIIDIQLLSLIYTQRNNTVYCIVYFTALLISGFCLVWKTKLGVTSVFGHLELKAAPVKCCCATSSHTPRESHRCTLPGSPTSCMGCSKQAC